MSGQRRRLDGRGQMASGREGGRCETGGLEGEAVAASEQRVIWRLQERK